MTAFPFTRPDRPAIEQLEERIAPATFVVTTLADIGDGSLRDAVTDANAAAGDDRIVFAVGLAGEITLASGPITISDDLVIRGPESDRIVVSGNVARIFQIDDGVATDSKVKLISLRFRDGVATGNGGAIQSFEKLVIRDCVFRDSFAISNGGAVWVSGANLSVRDTDFRNNRADLGGGALWAAEDVHLRTSIFTGNSSVSPGGAVSLTGSGAETKAVVVDAFFEDNQSRDGAGAVSLFGVESALIRTSIMIANSTVGDNRHGGGIALSGSFLTLTGSRISDNSATGDGGGIHIGPNSGAVIEHSVVKRNQATGDGGGILSNGSLFLTDSQIVKNISGTLGGGIRTEETATGGVAIINSLIKGNTAGSTGGGLNLSNPSDKLIDHSIISGNSSATAGGGLRAANNTLTVFATTFAGNDADSGGGVSLIDSTNPLRARFIDSFIINNHAASNGGGIEESTANAPALQRTAVRGNTAPVNPNFRGTFVIS